MSAILKQEGACPICDRTVPRLLRRVGQLLREVYVCPHDGMVAYGPQRMSLQDWAASLRHSATVPG